MIHFIHRSLAYILVILAVIWTFKAFQKTSSPAFKKWRWKPVAFVVIQTALGIFSALSSIWIRPAKWNIFEWMAQLHQLAAILLLLSLIGVLFFLRGKQKAKSLKAIEPTVI